MKEKIFKTAPLPFQGQKRNFIKQFQTALTEFVELHGVTTVVDLFGGSGLLSHTAKRMFPQLRVVYNDFDGFTQRLESIDATNEILSEIRPLLAPLDKGARVDPIVTRSILEVIKQRESRGIYVDYITLSSSLLFSANYATTYEALSRERLYNNIKLTDYNVAGYIEGLEVARKDYKALYDEFEECPGVLFVIDPPYLSTDVSTYSSMKYWRLKNYLDVLNLLKDDHYVFFTSDKSSLVELFEWLEANFMLRNPFSRAKVSKHLVRVNKSGGYTDLMYYKAAKR